MLPFRRPCARTPGPGEETARSTDQAGRPASPRREHRGGIRTMPHTPKRWSFKGVAFAASLTVIFAACGNSAASPSASSAPATTAPSTAPASAAAPSAAAFDGMVYPTTGDAPCGVAPYDGQDEEDHGDRRPHRRVPAVQPGRRVPSEGRVQRSFGIQDSDYLDEARRRTRLDPRHRRTAPAPTSSRSGARATGSSWRPTPTTGATRP